MNAPRTKRMIALWALCSLLALAVVARLAGLGVRPLMHDESLFAYYSWQVMEKLKNDETPIYQHMPILHGPALELLTGEVFYHWGDSIAHARLLIALCSLLVIGLLTWLAPARLRWAVALGLLSSPTLFFYSRFFRNEMLFYVPIAIGLWAWWRARRPQAAGWQQALGAAVAMAAFPLALAVKENSLFFYASGLAYFGFAFLLRTRSSAARPNSNEQTILAQTKNILAHHGWRLGIFVGLGIGFAIVAKIYAMTAPSSLVPDGNTSGTFGESIRQTLGAARANLQATWDYWEGQHSEHRISGALHYHLPILLTYELPLLLALWLALTLDALRSLKRLGWYLGALAGWTLFWMLWRSIGWGEIPRGGLVPWLESLKLSTHWPAALFWIFMPMTLAWVLGWLGSRQGNVALRRGLYTATALCLLLFFGLLRSWFAGGTDFDFRWLYGDDFFFNRICGFLHMEANLSMWVLGMLIAPMLVWTVFAERERKPWAAFMMWWAACSLFQYSVAGEKVPWLTVHIALPLYLACGWAWQRPWRRLQARPRLRLVVIAFALIGLGISARNDWHLMTDRAADPAERLVYNHTTVAFDALCHRYLDRWATQQGGQEPLLVFRSHPAWPAYWYFRDYKYSAALDKETIARASLVILPRAEVSDEQLTEWGVADYTDATTPTMVAEYLPQRRAWLHPWPQPPALETVTILLQDLGETYTPQEVLEQIEQMDNDGEIEKETARIARQLVRGVIAHANTQEEIAAQRRAQFTPKKLKDAFAPARRAYRWRAWWRYYWLRECWHPIPPGDQVPLIVLSPISAQ